MTSLAGKASTKGIAAEKKEMLQQCMAIIIMTKTPTTQQIAKAVFVSIVMEICGPDFIAKAAKHKQTQETGKLR
jgi:hypothetical protein